MPDLSTLLPVLIRDVVVPEIMTAIRAHQNATNGQMPTSEQVLAALDTDYTRFENIGLAFLSETSTVQIGPSVSVGALSEPPTHLPVVPGPSTTPAGQ